MFCPNCGAKINEGVKFCTGCGYPTASAALSPEMNAPTVIPAPEPVYAPPPQPAYAPPPPPPPEPVYAPPPQPAYAPPPPQAPEPVYAPPQPAYAPPPPQAPEPVYAPPQPQAPEPVYAPPPPPPSPPQSYAPQQYGQPQESPYAPAYAPPGSSKPTSSGTLADKISMPVLIIIGVVALLLVVFSALWLFTDVFSPKADAGKASDRVTAEEKSPEPGKEQVTLETPASEERGKLEKPEPGALSPASVQQGFYALVEMNVEGLDMLEQYEAMGFDLASFYIEIFSESAMNIVTMGDVTECFYSIDGNAIIINGDGDIVNGKVEGDIITLDFGGMTMVYEWDPVFVPSSNPMATDQGTDPGTQQNQGIPREGGDVRVNGESEFLFSPSTTGVWSIWTAYNGDTDPTLGVYVSGGAELAWDDDSANNLNALIGLYLVAGETYTIRAGSFGSEPSYSLFVAPSPSLWESGDTVSVSRPTVFSFKPYTSGTWVFETTNNWSTDPYLMVVDSNNRHMVSDDDSGEGINARISVDLTGGEVYIIMALTADDEPGPYDLVVKLG